MLKSGDLVIGILRFDIVLDCELGVTGHPQLHSRGNATKRYKRRKKKRMNATGLSSIRYLTGLDND